MESRKQENLEAFAKAYGLVRWFHPSDEAQRIDWSKFALYGVSQIEPCNTRKELKRELERLFQPFAPGVIFSESQYIKHKPTTSHSDTSGLLPVYWQHFGVDLGLWSNYYVSKRTHRPLQTRNISKAVLYGHVPVDNYAGCKLTIKARIKKLTNQEDFRIYLNLTDAPDAYLTYCADSVLPPLDNQGVWTEHSYSIEVNKKHRNHAIYWSIFTEGEGAIAVDSIVLVNNTSGETIHTFLTGNKLNQCKWNPVVYQRIHHDQHVVFQTKALLFDKLVSPNDYHTEKIADKLYITVPLCLMGNQERTYPEGDSSAIEEMQKQVNQLLPNQELYMKADLIVTWNVIKYFSPYLAERSVDWDKQLTDALKRQYQYLKDSAYHTEPLERMLAILEDAHVSVKAPVHEGIEQRRYLPFTLRKIDGQLMIKNSFDPNIEPGDIIHSINGVDALKDFNFCESLISAGTHRRTTVAENQWLYRHASADKDSLSLEVIRNNTKKHLTIYPISLQEHLLKQRKSKKEAGRWLNKNTLYLHLGYLDYSDVQQLLSQRQSHQTVIIDIREGSRFLLRQLIPLISMGADTLKQQNLISQTPEICYPNTPIILDLSYPIEPKAPNKKNIFLINSLNISNHEETLDYVRYAGIGYLIGTPTGGCCGRINKIPLPSGGEVVFTGTKWLSRMGPHHYFYRTGIQPDSLIDDTVESIHEGRDVALEKAIQIANH